MFTPLDSEAIREFERLEIPNTVARAGWVISPEVTKKVIDGLGLQYPVAIRYMKGYRTHGSHYARVNPDRHRITLNQDLPIREASKTLVHELVHACQSEAFVERTGRPHNMFYHEAYRQANGDWGVSYEENAYEIECNDIAERTTAIGVILLKEVT